MKPFTFLYLRLSIIFLIGCTGGLGELNVPQISYDEEQGVFSEQIRKPTVDEIREEYGRMWLDSLCSTFFQGRKAGTYGAQLAYEFLTSTVSDMEYGYETQSFETEAGTTIRNIIVTIPGQTDSTIIVGAHYDGATQSNSESHYYAANDNASGTVTLLLFLKHLSGNHFDSDKTMIICFWGCEEVFEGRAFRASWHYSHTIPKDLKARVLLYINLDTMGHQNDAHKMLMEYPLNNRAMSFVDSFKTSRSFDYVKKVRMENLYSDFYSFHAVGIPFINFHDYCVPECEHPVHSLRDTPEFISVRQLNDVTYDIERIIESY